MEKVLALALSFYSYCLIKEHPKIMAMVKTGDSEQSKYERMMDVVVAQLFAKSYGVGG